MMNTGYDFVVRYRWPITIVLLTLVSVLAVGAWPFLSLEPTP